MTTSTRPSAFLVTEFASRSLAPASATSFASGATKLTHSLIADGREKLVPDRGRERCDGPSAESGLRLVDVEAAGTVTRAAEQKRLAADAMPLLLVRKQSK